jgi:type IV secretory pathway VirB3-like protein
MCIYIYNTYYLYTHTFVCVSVCLHSFTCIPYIYYKLIIYPIVHPIVHPITYAHVSSQNQIIWLYTKRIPTWMYILEFKLDH